MAWVEVATSRTSLVIDIELDKISRVYIFIDSDPISLSWQSGQSVNSSTLLLGYLLAH